jgi:hypothetical protein
MQRRRNKLRFILLALLTMATMLVLWWIQPENRLDVDADVFQVPALNTISRVELTSDSSKVALSYEDNRWRINDQYDADAGMVQVLFATLQQARPKRPVARTQRDSIFNTLSRSGVRVELFAGSEKRKEFFAGGNEGKSQAYFADPESQEVYVMTIPGYRVYVSGILELGVNGWRDKLVFNFNWETFKTLEARFPQRPAGNFTVSMTRNFFGIEGIADADTAKLNTFLDDVSLLTVEEYLPEPGLSDSLLRREPELEFLVSDIANRSYRLRMFNFGPRQEVYGIIQDSQIALFHRRKFQGLLKPKSFFRKK